MNSSRNLISEQRRGCHLNATTFDKREGKRGEGNGNLHDMVPSVPKGIKMTVVLQHKKKKKRLVP